MQVTALVPTQPQSDSFSMGGICPHCAKASVFVQVTNVKTDQESPGSSRVLMCCALQCQGCRKYILGLVTREIIAGNQGKMTYQAHYPLGKPDDNVAGGIPSIISADFQEALRCRWVNAYNATVEMCRRAIQSAVGVRRTGCVKVWTCVAGV